MKSLKNSFLLLLLAAVFTFNACEGTDEEPFVEPEFTVYDLHTLNPDMNDERVLFKATLNTTDSNITYGFMWYVPNPDGNPDITTLQVGVGAINGEFSLPMTELPKNTNMIVCSYVRPTDSAFPEVEQQIGEEIDFIWDF